MASARHEYADAPRFSRRWWIRSGRSFFWVAIITVLIWVYADLEKTETAEFHAKLVLTTGASKDLALLDSPDMTRREIDLTFRAKGARSGLDRCGRDLTAQSGSIPVDLASAYSPGKHNLQIADVLNRSEIITRSGLTVLSANPPTVTVDIDRTVHVPDLEVKFRYSGASVAESTVRPDRMGVTVAKSRWEEISRLPGKPTLETVLVDLQGIRADSNKPLRVAVAPFLAGTPAVPVLPDRDTVEVELKVAALSAEKTFTVPVRLLVPPGWAEDDTWQRFILKREDPLAWRKEITVQGSRKDVDRLRPEDIDAYVVLGEDDKKQTESWLKHDVEIRLPRDMQVQVVGEKPSVRLRLDPRPASPT